MGKLEELTRKNIRRTKLQEAIISYIVSGGRIGGDLLIKQVADDLLGTDFSTSPPRRSEIVKTAASRLTRMGLLKFESGFYLATAAGEKLWNDWQMLDYKIKRPRKWDKKWRVVIFDIPEKKNRVRDRVREILSAAGFQKLQNSVWVYPYDCQEIIALLKANYHIGNEVLYMEVTSIENDRWLKKIFDLK